MTSFTTRVELHGALSADYEKLHEAMRRQGFFTAITSDKGTTYYLPTAEYDFVGNLSRTDVLDKAKVAAATTGKAYSVLVTESAGRTWHNLLAVKSRAA
jgi:hypothetical protein